MLLEHHTFPNKADGCGRMDLSKLTPQLPVAAAYTIFPGNR
jgi:hypothetical protein